MLPGGSLLGGAWVLGCIASAALAANWVVERWRWRPHGSAAAPSSSAIAGWLSRRAAGGGGGGYGSKLLSKSSLELLPLTSPGRGAVNGSGSSTPSLGSSLSLLLGGGGGGGEGGGGSTGRSLTAASGASLSLPPSSVVSSRGGTPLPSARWAHQHQQQQQPGVGNEGVFGGPAEGEDGGGVGDDALAVREWDGGSSASYGSELYRLNRSLRHSRRSFSTATGVGGTGLVVAAESGGD